MAVTYEGIQSASIENADLVITKPTGLAVGDLMVAGITFSDDGSGGGGVNTPSGWTLENFQDNSGEHLSVFTKVATSGDVAASNFTFTRSGGDGSYHLIGHILRVSDFGILAGETSGEDLNSSTTVTATGFTPSRSDTLFIAFLAHFAGTSQDNVSVALATDNPSWTERADTSFNDASVDTALAAYTASRTQATATGTITGTVGSAVGIKMLVVLSLSERTDSATTPTTKLNAYAYSPIAIDIGADAITESPTLDEYGYTSWTNSSKPSTVWTNPDK